MDFHAVVVRSINIYPKIPREGRKEGTYKFVYSSHNKKISSPEMPPTYCNTYNSKTLSDDEILLGL